MSELPIVLRPAHDGDAHFVINSWLKSMKDSAWFACVGKPMWTGHRAAILALMAKCDVVVACSAEDPDTILGWAVTQPNTVHYVYVKRDFRKFGVARALLANHVSQPCVYTHRTYRCDYLPIPKYWKYDPYPALIGDYQEAA